MAKNTLVSLTDTGGVAAGFGLQVSAPIGVFGNISSARLVNMSSTLVVLAYIDASGFGQAAVFDTTTNTPKVRSRGCVQVGGVVLVDFPFGSLVPSSSWPCCEAVTWAQGPVMFLPMLTMLTMLLMLCAGPVVCAAPRHP